MREKLSMEQLDRKTVEEFKAATKNPIVVVSDNIRSMNNIGSIFRTCDAFLVEEFVLCGISPVPPHRDIQKTALGATESVKWSYCKETSEAVERLCKDGYGLALRSESDAVRDTQNGNAAPRGACYRADCQGDLRPRYGDTEFCSRHILRCGEQSGNERLSHRADKQEKV